MSISIDEDSEGEGHENTRRSQFVVFTIGEQQYCVDIGVVREVRIASTITALPGAPDYVRGVINLRGSVIPVCDLRVRFGQGRTELSKAHAIVIVLTEKRLTGLLVDEVCDIIEASESNLSPIPQADGRASPYFDGLITEGDTCRIIVSPRKVLQQDALPEGMVALHP